MILAKANPPLKRPDLVVGLEPTKPFELQTAAITSRLDPRSASIMLCRLNRNNLAGRLWFMCLPICLKKDLPRLSEIDVLKHVQLFVPNLWMRQHDNTLIVLKPVAEQSRGRSAPTITRPVGLLKLPNSVHIFSLKKRSYRFWHFELLWVMFELSYSMLYVFSYFDL